MVWLIAGFGVYNDLAKADRDAKLTVILFPISLFFENSSYLTENARKKLINRTALFIIIGLVGLGFCFLADHYGYYR